MSKQRLKLMIMFLALWGFGNATAIAKTIASGLTVEQKTEPLGIDNLKPGFSWLLSSDENNVYQEAYQIVLVSKAGNKESTIWNSGKVNSKQNKFIISPKSLTPNTKYYWRVKLWIKGKGETGWSQENSFHTAIEQKEWAKSKWIGYDFLPETDRIFPGIHGLLKDASNSPLRARTVVPEFRKKFNLQGKVIQSAQLYIAGLGHYEAFINGKRIGDSFLSPGWTNYQKTALFNSYDLTKELNQSGNELSAFVGPGFRYVNDERYRKLVIGDQKPILKAVLVIQYKNGETERIYTDESWETQPSPITFSSIYGGEDYDANLEQNNNWRAAKILSDYHPEMKSEMDFPLREMETFKPVDRKKIGPNTFLYDFGQNASGIVSINYKGPKGNQIKITPAEVLDDQGNPSQAASGGPFYFTYVSSGKKEGESWKPKFTYYGFRYALVEFTDANYDNFEINLLHTRNSSPSVGQLETSSQHFNDVNKLIQWGIKSNLASVATDCPHREKLGWLEQTHLIGNSMQFNFNIYHLYNKIIDDMIDGQLDNGLVPDIVPEYVVFTGGFRDSPEWGSASVIIPYYHYQWYGDQRILEKAYPMMEKYFEYLRSKSKNYILDHGLGDWFDIGPKAPGESQLTPKAVTATSTFFYDAKILAQVSNILNKPEKAQHYQDLANKINAAYQEKFLDKSSNTLTTTSQTGLAMPLYFGMLEENSKQNVVKQLMETIERDQYALTAGDVGYRYLLRALAENNMSEVIYKMNNRNDVPGYGFQIKHGATALTESWQAYKFVSNNHMMLGHLMEWLYQDLAGIKQETSSTGFDKVLIHPFVNKDFDWVHANYQSINGLIRANWKRSGNNLILDIEIPSNVEGKVQLPKISANQVSASIPGSHKKAEYTLEDLKDNTFLNLKSGKYSIKLADIKSL